MKGCESDIFGNKTPLLAEEKVDYHSFKRQFSASGFSLDMLVIWAQIRSFIKGSIEAVDRGRPLTRAEYVDGPMIGSRRCRLSKAQRAAAYDAYERYEGFLDSTNNWDDCDRVVKIIKGLKSNNEVRDKYTFSRIYVDEIQDYTQAEICLFFLLAGRNGIFFAGDPAQSVVEGVEFRFEEVRSVAHYLYGEEDRKQIPDKPLVVTRNFRSHAGVLNVASQVSCIAFPMPFLFCFAPADLSLLLL